MAVPFALETQVALSAVNRACHLTSSIFHSLVKGETLTKSDTSPVTIGDFSAQAVINTILHSAFPNDPIVGEEDAKDLRHETEGRILRERVTELANSALSKPLGNDIGVEEKAEWGIGEGVKRSADELLTAIDKGTYGGSRTGRMWCLDPIDGTKGFLRGEQYAVCLAFIVDATVQVGVIGCPNLPFEDADGQIVPGQGSIYVAVRGQGAEKRPFPPTPAKPVRLGIPNVSNPTLRLLESVEAAHASHSFNDLVSKSLNITAPSLRMDSQAKYCAVATQTSGPSPSSEAGHGGDIYLRLPVPGKNYLEKIWDHAAGALIISESGGAISDSYGRPLDFGLGRTLGENFGVVACAKGEVHEKVIKAIAEAREAEKKLKGE
ncbi:hypothetical protein FRB96_000716 [Tulasnella sp. 330]|nr:hypothetical protein FRB96_000716 [Tulasnella sp. 330]KAG8882966.1 hypothetical protein FRB97_007453 [Tulasnella sp. 331]KAG8887165.1 hypothetical protein FRB98_000421 [Tulasnella sp. 332]